MQNSEALPAKKSRVRVMNPAGIPVIGIVDEKFALTMEDVWRLETPKRHPHPGDVAYKVTTLEGDRLTVLDCEILPPMGSVRPNIQHIPAS